MTPDELLRQVIQEARQLHIPISHQIQPHVVLNSRAKMRFGRCIKQGSIYVIELSTELTEIWAMKQTLAHEILHTCFGCHNHGNRWKRYAELMNSAYGYQIHRVDPPLVLGAKHPPVRYRLRCTSCGAEICRMKRSKLVEHPDLYRCRCGGKLVLESENELK